MMLDPSRSYLLVLAGAAVLFGSRVGQLYAGEDRGRPPGSAILTDEVESVASSRILFWLDTASGSGPITGVDLWYCVAPAQDGSVPRSDPAGREWMLDQARYGGGDSPSAGTEGPIVFDAESDGLYGFYIVLRNAAGASAPPPEPETAPQKWVRVDRRAPDVQVLTLRPDAHFQDNRDVHIRWTVQDGNLPNRPVKLHYRSAQTKTYRLIADLLEADGSYRWTVPESISGRIELKVSAADRAGNTGRYIADRMSVDPRTMQLLMGNAGMREGGASNAGKQSLSNSTAGMAAGIGRRYSDPPAAFEVPDEQAARRARKLYDLGTWHRLRGEQAVAILRYQEALKLDPDFLEALNDLGGALCLQGRHEVAESTFQALLEKAPRHRAALKSLALVQATRRNYRSSRETLHKLLLLAPEDAEAWLYLGDVTMFMGDRQDARTAWVKAASFEHASDEVKGRSAKRLAIYQTPAPISHQRPALLQPGAGG
jgi:Flp pilus assembly protein TadD